MITLDQAKQYLASIGLTIPDFVLQLLVGRANTIEPCLTEHYDTATATLILMYLIGIFGVVQGDRLVTSETAPKTGASRSYRFGTMEERYKGQLNSLASLDTFGCTDGLVPAMPGPNVGLWLGKGGCC